jgi:hypothetical protein
VKLEFDASFIISVLQDVGFSPSDMEAEALTKAFKARLREMLGEAPVVGHKCRATYACFHEKGDAMWRSVKSSDSHRAKLVCIEEVKP